MTYQDFQDCLDKYAKALLKIIPIFYAGIPLSDSKTIQKRIKKAKDKHSLEVELKQAKGWEKMYPILLKTIQEIVEKIDIVTESLIPEFRYKIYFPVYDKKDDPLIEGNTEEIAKNIITFFISDLARLRSEGVKENTARRQIIKIMDEQRNEYIQKYEKKLKRMKAIKGKLRREKLGKGKGFKIPKEKFSGTLRETYDWCKKEEAEKGEKWTGTRIAKRADRLLKSRYGDKYDADFKHSYLENRISEIKQGKL